MPRNRTANDEDGQENCHTEKCCCSAGALVATVFGAQGGGGLISNSPVYTPMSRLLRKATPLSAWYDTAVSQMRGLAGLIGRASLRLTLSPSLLGHIAGLARSVAAGSAPA